MDGIKALLHDMRWDVYNSYNKALVKVGYSVAVADKDRRTVIWVVVDEHVVEEGVEHEYLGLQVFILIYLMKRGRDVLWAI